MINIGKCQFQMYDCQLDENNPAKSHVNDDSTPVYGVFANAWSDRHLNVHLLNYKSAKTISCAIFQQL